MQVRVDFRPAYALAVVELGAGESIKAEGGAMVSKSSHVAMETSAGGGKGAKGLLKSLGRAMLGGESFFMNTFTAQNAPGEVALAPSLVGDIAMHQLNGQVGLQIQGSSYLASSTGVEIDTKFGGAKSLFSGEGLFWLKAHGQGTVLFNAFGAVRELNITEPFWVDTGHIVAFEETLQFNIRRVGSWFSTFFSGEGLVCEFTGQGKLWIQTRNPVEFGQAVGSLLPPRQG